MPIVTLFGRMKLVIPCNKKLLIVKFMFYSVFKQVFYCSQATLDLVF